MHCLELSITVKQRRQWHPTPVLLPGKSHGWRSLVGCNPWGRTESDTSEVTQHSITQRLLWKIKGNNIFLCLLFFFLNWISPLRVCYSYLPLKTSSPWYLVINNSCPDVIGDSTAEQRYYFSILSGTQLFISIHSRLVAEKDILIEYIP